jgi:hypothetical protein
MFLSHALLSPPRWFCSLCCLFSAAVSVML